MLFGQQRVERMALHFLLNGAIPLLGSVVNDVYIITKLADFQFSEST